VYIEMYITATGGTHRAAHSRFFSVERETGSVRRAHGRTRWCPSSR
jgi:hypothetical protein